MYHQAAIIRKCRPLLAACALLSAAACTTTRQPGNGSAALTGTDTAMLFHKRWVLAGFPDTTFERPEKDIYIVFEDTSRRVAGFGGCNAFRGQYELREKSLQLSSMASTKMWCSNGPAEQRFMQALEQANTYEVMGDSMQLLRDDRPLAYFYAVHLH